MKYTELPLQRVASGQVVPVSIWDAKGNLLLRKGQVIASEQHKELLAAHGAQVLDVDYKAWTRSYDRIVNRMSRDGASLEALARLPMPSTIQDGDYAVGFDIVGGWLDVHEVHKALLSQGSNAKNPLEKMESTQKRAMALLDADADHALFVLMQALPDLSVSYAAKHALLAAVLCELTARKLQVPELLRPVLFQAALTMNLALARMQDELVRQTEEPSPQQREDIATHPARSVDILRGYGVDDADLLDMVAGHHEIDLPTANPRNRECRLIMQVVDQFIAKMSTRATRTAVSAPSAAKAMVDMRAQDAARVAAALSAAVGFYPPGTYVSLVNGETAVSVRRGGAAHAPLVVSLLRADGLSVLQYVARDTADKAFAVRAAVSAERLKITVSQKGLEAALARLAPSA